MRVLENILLRTSQIRAIEGQMCLDSEVLENFLDAPYDPLPEFEGPPNYQLHRRGRGKDHPRYGRFVYALARHYQPERIVEIGTFAGGTAVGFGRALTENGAGQLICVDQDSYSRGTFPEVAQRNLERVGVPESQFRLCCGDSKQWLPKLGREFPGQIDLLLVDGDHTYEGALADLRNSLPLMRPGGLVLVHDVDRRRRMDEATDEHPHPVYEAFHAVAAEHQLDWCILKFIRKHLGVLRTPEQDCKSIRLAA